MNSAHFFIDPRQPLSHVLWDTLNTKFRVDIGLKFFRKNEKQMRSIPLKFKYDS